MVKTINDLEIQYPPTKSTSKGGANQPNSEKVLHLYAKPLFSHPSKSAGLEGVGGFKFKIEKKSPTAQEIVEGIKKWKCPSCHRESITSDKIKTILCGCGEYYKCLN